MSELDVITIGRSSVDLYGAQVGEARCVIAFGTHLSNPQTRACVLEAVKLARKNGARTALDIDYRPNLWGLSRHDDDAHNNTGSNTKNSKGP